MPEDKSFPRKKVLALFFTAAALAAGIFIYLRVSAVKKEIDFFETGGIVEAVEFESAPKIPGTIEWLCCAEGDHVKAGQAAFRLDDRELKARLEQAGASVKVSEERIKESDAAVKNASSQRTAAGFELKASSAEAERAGALLEDARRNLVRAKGLFTEGYISRKEIDSYETAYEATRAQLDVAKAREKTAAARLTTADFEVKARKARSSASMALRAEAEAALNVAEANLADTTVAFPSAGVVAYKAKESGEFVKGGAAVYTVYDLEKVLVRVDVDETFVAGIRLDDPVKVLTSGGSKEFDAKAVEIGEVAQFATQRDVTRGRQDIKTFRVKARLINPDGSLKPGMTVTVRISLKDRAKR